MTGIDSVYTIFMEPSAKSFMCIFSFSQEHSELGTIIIPIFQVREPKVKEINTWPNVSKQRRGSGIVSQAVWPQEP